MLLPELEQGAATVVNLAQHMVNLKQRALDLAGSIPPEDRGFFTPSEDEQTRHLLISYWQSRNALFEVVSSLHHVDRFEVDDRPAALAIAYAGALVLVDVARFLLENFHHRPVVRGKLNEPEPHFGIPEGTYDFVQKSLTSPVHAWHLYHAMVYVRDNWRLLRQTGKTDPAFNVVLDLINQLQLRLDVSVDSFVLARTRVRARSLRTRLTRYLLGRALYGLQKYVSAFMADKYVKFQHQPGLLPQIYSELEATLCPGDIIVVRKEHAFTNYFLPGYWPHAALYVGTLNQLVEMNVHQHENVREKWQTIEEADCERPHRVLEAMKDGVRVRSLSNPFRSDAVAIVRPQLPPSQVAEAIARGFFHMGKSYYFDFDFARSDRMVCTEVVYRSFEGIGGIAFELTRRAGRMTLSAEDLLKMAIDQNGFTVHAVYCPAKSDVVNYSDGAVSILAGTIGKKSVR